MRILCISDTHNQHRNIPPRIIANYNRGLDMIIHAGDITEQGTRREVDNFLTWFNDLNFEYKIFVAGNHDFFFENAPQEDIDELLSKYPNVIYLNDSGVEIEGIKIWGSPVQPWFYNWAFNRKGEEIKPHWNLIPPDTNILITHGPVAGILDKNRAGQNVGCPHLLSRLNTFENLKLHVSGHIHEGYGQIKEKGTTFVNASVLNYRYYMTNEPIEVNI